MLMAGINRPVESGGLFYGLLKLLRGAPCSSHAKN